MNKNICLLYGGVSGEHEVSCISAQFIEKTIKESGKKVTPVYIDRHGNWFKQNSVEKASIASRDILEENHCYLIKGNPAALKLPNTEIQIDFVFPMIHGTTGEDGRLQGLLEFLDIPYAGAGVLSSAICMDKYYSKMVFHENQISQVKFLKFDKIDWEKSPKYILKEVAQQFEFPVFVKPSNMGSSVGVSRVSNGGQLQTAIELAFEYDDQILCEQGMRVREIELSILGNYPDYKVSIPGEIIPNHEFYSYEAKYLDDQGANLEIPANLTSEQIKQLQNLAIQSFKAVKADGFARIDFFIEKNNQSNKPEIYLNEINTLPGFTPISMFPMLWEKSGLKPVDLINTIIQLGIEKFEKKKKLNTTRHT